MNQNNLFDNPMVRSARASMTTEQLEDYQEQGKYMFEMLDFTKDPLDAYIISLTESLKAGIHPSYLEKDEQLIMENAYGKEWFKKFGWDSIEF